MHEALLYDKTADRGVQCRVCLRHCVIPPGGRGYCRTRENIDGTLYTLIYDRVSAVCLDPIEKKPLYHFYPGSRVLSLGSLGCSFRCPGCQNWHISQQAPAADAPSLSVLSPGDAVREAVRRQAAGICWTYNDPAIWLEHTLEGARAARAAGLYTAYVTNGTATREHLDRIGPFLDAYRVDIKAMSAKAYRAISGFADYPRVLEGVAYARERWGMHVECVTNITPTVNDSDTELRAIARWIASSLGADVPWHITRFHPCEGFAHLPPTPLERLEQAYVIGREEGLQYIYVGNVPGDARQQTCCPGCGRSLVRRNGFSVVQMEIRNSACPTCHTAIAGRWD